MPSAYGQRMRLRLFLEGIEVPVIAANVQTAPNSPMVAAIQVPPLAEGTRLLPRTLVHLFFLDTYGATNLHVTLTGANAEQAGKRHPSAYEVSRDDGAGTGEPGTVEETIDNALVDNRSNNYKLLFGGEMVGFQWTKSQNNRSLVLQCSDWSNYWDYAYQWNNTGIFGPGIKAVFSGGATNLFTDFLSSKGSMITAILQTGRCNSFPRLKGLAAGIIRLMEAIGGSYYPRPMDDKKPAKKFAGQNIFFSLAELRLHITHMIAAFEDDPTSSRLVSRHGYGGMFDRALGGLGGQVSMRKSLNAIQKIIFHETYAQPCPLYKPGVGDDPHSGSARVKLRDDPQFSEMANVAESVASVLGDYITALEEKEPVDGQPSDPALQLFRGAKIAFIKLMIERINGSKSLVNKTLGQMRNAPETARSSFSQTNRLLAQAASLMKRWTPNGPPALRNQIKDRLVQAQGQMKRVEDLTILTTPPKQRDPARLNQQILRPDIWFGAPPRCNVLFPEDYASLSYQRMFLEEPTRFMLKTNDEFFGEDFLFDKFYFAPQAGSLKADKAQLSTMLKNDLLDHELFTGILPIFEKMGEFNVFAAKSGTQKNTTKVSFAQRSANFLYFKHRFNSRQMRVDGKFNPMIACGAPGLVIDKYVDRQQIEQYNQLREKAELPPLEIGTILGTNFLGNFTAITHRVSQMEPMGRTEITCSYPRQPEESVEFLGAPEKVQTIRKRAGEDAIRVTDIAAIQGPRVGSLGPNGGRVTGVVDVTSRYTTRQSTNEASQLANAGTAGQRLPIFQRGFNPKDTQVLVHIGRPVSAISILSPKLEEFLGSPDREAVFSAFRVVEEIPRYRKEQVDLPAEEFIRPGWYGDIWTTGKIGRVWEDFFGIGAITDGQVITDPSGASLGVAEEDKEMAAAEAAQAESADDPRLDAPAVLELEQGSSIQQAVEFLVLTYSYIRQSGADVDEFIQSYKWRPIASMVDMFGTSDLTFSADGGNVTQGWEGFHSRAFGPYDDVFGIVGPDLEDIVGIKRGSTAAGKADTRKRKHDAVQQFVSAMKFSRAILG